MWLCHEGLALLATHLPRARATNVALLASDTGSKLTLESEEGNGDN